MPIVRARTRGWLRLLLRAVRISLDHASSRGYGRPVLKRPSFIVVWLSLIVGGCNSDSGNGDCEPGSQGCQCVAGTCSPGLDCISDLCSLSSGDGDGDGNDDGDGDCSPPAVVPVTPIPADPACLVDTPCVTDSNCPSGYTCNDALDPPECSQIYCGTAGTPCGNDSSCDTDLSCDAGICKLCNICGDLCEVDFATDPEHCGCCNNPVSGGESCVGGQPTCPAGQTPCDGVCTSLDLDPNNCGSCGNQVGSGAVCNNGVVECENTERTLCGDSCYFLEYDSDHCGSCDYACPEGATCKEGQCTESSIDPTSCDEACAGVGLVCDPNGEHRVQYGDGLTCPGAGGLYSIDCASVPLESFECEFSCSCWFEKMTCYCL